MSKKSSSITFRIDEKSEQGLRKLAEANRVSLNTLANQIFSDYIECEVFTKKFGTLKISTDSFRRILSFISEKDLIDLAVRGGSQEAKEFMLFKWKELNLDVVTDFIKMYFEFCGYGRCDMDKTESKISLSVHHDLKEKGSLYLKHFLESLVRASLDKSCSVTTTEDTVTLSFQS
jgi:proteasome assembly chaperone (PAC2) family protein